MSTPVSPQVKAEWAYSGKALRVDCVKNAIITILIFIALILVGSMLKMVPGFVQEITAVATEGEAPSEEATKKAVETSSLYGTTMTVLWLLALVGLAGIWGVYAVKFLSKTKIRYLLTAERLEMIRGSDRKAMDLVHVEDLTLEQSLTDRIVNGGVGTIVASASGKGNASKIYVLKLEGVEDPQDVFDTVNRARIEVRQRHGIATVRGVER